MHILMHILHILMHQGCAAGVVIGILCESGGGGKSTFDTHSSLTLRMVAVNSTDEDELAKRHGSHTCVFDKL